MPTPTYTPLANLTLGSSASSVTFSSISGSYRDLVLVVNGKGTTLTDLYLRINGDTGSNYSIVIMEGDGSSASSSSYNVSNGMYGSAVDTNTILTRYNIMDYSATDKHKSILYRVDAPAASWLRTRAVAGRWASTSAITTLLLYPGSGSFVAGMSVELYGVAA